MWKIQDTLPIQVVVIQLEKLQVTNGQAGFQALKQCARTYRAKYADASIGDVQGVQIARQVFRAIGVDPTKRRPSSEALLRRALKAKELYTINTLVDVGNWCSLDFLLPICIYDSGKIVGDVSIRLGRQDEAYLGLNNRMLHLHNRYVIADECGPFGSPITDSQRTAVDLETTRAHLGIFTSQEYDPDTLRSHAELFAQRAMDVCGGELLAITCYA